MLRPQHRNALPQGFEIQEYVIDSVIGHGGFGITYLAKDIHLDQWVAIKEYLPNDLAVREGVSTVYAKSNTDEEAFEWGLQRFIMEARTLAQFQHPNIVQVMRFFEAHRTAYMVMAYQEGESLSQILKNRAKMEEAELMGIILPIINGLEAVHKVGFLHRDIKPGNIFIRKEDGTPVLLDFGAARYAIGQRSTSLTSIVTPGYAPFEQYDSKSTQGPWTDIYALGGVMYYAMTGNVPTEVVGRLKRDDMPRAVDVCAGRYKIEILRAVDWALALDEDARPQNLSQWREALLSPPLKIMPDGMAKTAKNNPAPFPFWTPKGAWLLVAILLFLPSAYWANRMVQHWQAVPDEATQRKQIEAFVGNYFAATERADIESLLSAYAERVDYFHWGPTSRAAVRMDKVSYFDKWPEVHYSLASEVELMDGLGKKDIISVSFLMNFNAYNPNKFNEAFNTIEGKARHTWKLIKEQNQYKIVSEKQQVIERKRSYKPLKETAS